MSIFQRARTSTEEQPEEPASIFKFIKQHKQENIIPPVGIAKPELVQSFLENMEDEDKIRKDIAEVESYERENALQTGKREALGHGARALEGFFGGVTSFFNALSPDLELEEETGEVERHKAKPLPSTKEFREFTKGKTGKYLEPKSEFTKGSQEILEDIGSAFSTPFMGFWKSLLLPVGGQAVKQVIKKSGGGEIAQEVGKQGFMLISSIGSLGNAPKVARDAMNQTERMIPQGVRFSAQPTEQALNRIKNSPWYRTGRTSNKSPAMDEIARIEQKIQNGTIDAHDAMQLRRDINEARKKLGAWFQPDKPPNKKQALKYLDEVDDALFRSMENYGSRVRPDWLKNYKSANEAFKITERSRVLSDFIAEHAKPLQSQTAKILFHMGAASGGLSIPTVGALAGTGLAATKAIQITNRMIRSPILRNHYLDVIKHAAAGNSAAMNKSLQKFDILSRKMEEKDQKEKSSSSSSEM